MTKLSTLIALTAAAASGACSLPMDADDTAAVATDLGSGTGLKGEYYDNADFTALKMTRIDPTVRFDWQSGSPSPSMAADRFSVRWTGKVAASYGETYTFYVSSDDGVRLWVGGKLVIDAWSDHPATETHGTVALKAGQQTDIRLEYFNGYGLASVQLSWSSASLAKRVIPRASLYPSTATTAGGTTPPAPTTTATPPAPAPTTTATPPPPPAPTTTATPPPPPPPPAPTGTARPSYNKGTGFYVVGSKLYDASGNEFRIRGVNHLHWDSPSAGIPQSGANTERWDLDFNQPIANNIALMQKSIANKIVPMAGNWDGTCDENPATLSTMVSKWVATAPQWKAVEKYMLVNIANEWGPANSTVWRDQYIAAVGAVRAAGINATIVVDAGGCGQDLGDLTQYAAAVFNSDPQKNVIFDQHIYGMWQSGGSSSWQTDLTQGLDALAATGLPFVIGEFGPGRNIGPSPTDMTPGLIIQAAESRGFGWIAWAWDDPPGEWTNPINDTWFALSFTGNYNSSADLTTFGKDVVENAVYGLKKMGKPASIF